MQIIGLLFGMEQSFPDALRARIDLLGQADGVAAEFCSLDHCQMDTPQHYSVVLDRISHDVPFYRAVLKNMMLSGTRVVNNPFWWSADEKFFSYAACARAGIAVPRTALVPSKEMPPDTSVASFRNLHYPLDWDALFEYIGFPAFFKPHAGGGWKNVYKVRNKDEFFKAYDETGTLVMTLQQSIEFTEYYRCYVIGKKHVRIMPYDPRNPHHLRYAASFAPSDAMRKRMERDCVTICETLGYEFNTVEFAIEEGQPYAIDFTNPAPDAEHTSVGDENFEWVVETAARYLIALAKQKHHPPKTREIWKELLIN